MEDMYCSKEEKRKCSFAVNISFFIYVQFALTVLFPILFDTFLDTLEHVVENFRSVTTTDEVAFKL